MKNKVGRLIEMIVAKFLFAIAILFMSVTRTQRAQAVTYDSTGNVAWCDSALKAALNDTDAYLPAALGSDYTTYVKSINTGSCESYVRLLQQSEWQADGVIANYKTGHGGSNALPATTNAWILNSYTVTTPMQIAYADGATSNATYNQDLDAYPVISLVDDGSICITDGSVAGSADAPYTLTTNCNTDPTITLTTTGNLIVPKSGNITLAGKYTDPDSSQDLTITVTIQDDANHTATKTINATAPKTNADWSVSFSSSDLSTLAAGTYAGSTHVTVSIEDSNDYSQNPGSANVSGLGNIIIDRTAPTCGTWTVNGTTYATNTTSITKYTDSGAKVLPWNTGTAYTASLASNSDAGGSGLITADQSARTCNIANSLNSYCDLTITDNAGNSTTCRSPLNQVDAVTPTPVCTITKTNSSDTNTYQASGNTNTLYYNSNSSSGSFKVSATLQSGVTLISKLAQVDYNQLSPTDSWARDPATVTASGDNNTYTSTYSWSAANTNTTSPQVTFYTAAGKNSGGTAGVATCTDLHLLADGAAPSGFDLNYANKYINASTSDFSYNLALVRTSASDDQSGINEDSFKVYRYVGTLSDDTCSNYGSVAEVASGNLTLTKNSSGQVTAITVNNINSDSAYATGKCFQYELRVSDNVGNVGTFRADTHVKIDTTSPTCTSSSVTKPWTVNSVTYANNPTTISTYNATGAIVLPWNTGSGYTTYAATLSLDTTNDVGGSGLTQTSWSCTIANQLNKSCDVAVTDKAGNSVTCRSPINRVDSANPALTCSLANLSGQSYTNSAASTTYNNYYHDTTNNIFYYNSSTAGGLFSAANGGFTLNTTAANVPLSGITKVAFPRLANTAAADVTSPYSAGTPQLYSKAYAWASGTTYSASGAQAVITYGNGLTNNCSLSVKPDVTAPTGSTPGYADTYTTTVTESSWSLGVSKSDFSDTDSGIDKFVIQRREGTLTNGACSYTASFATPANNSNWVRDFSSMANGTVSVTDTFSATQTQGHCYQYQIVVIDRVGNQSKFAATTSYKVSLTEPTNTITNVTQPNNVYWVEGTSSIYYGKLSAATNIDVTVTADDPVSGINYVAFQNLADNAYVNGTAGSNHQYTRTYTLAANATTTYSGRVIDAHSNNAAEAKTATFDLIYDGNGPTGVGFTACPSTGYHNNTAIQVVGSYGTDTGASNSGRDDSQTYLERRTGTLNPATGECVWDSDSYTKVSGTGGNDTETYNETGSDGKCYGYRLVSQDHVGNITRSNACEVKIDIAAPVCGTTWQPAEVYPWNKSGTQAFTLSGSSDSQSGIDDSRATSSTPNGGSTSGYTCTAAAQTGATCTVTIYDRAGHTAVCTSPENKVDPASPALTSTINEGTNPEYQYVTTSTVGTSELPTLYFNSNALANGSSFDWEIELTEPDSGIHQTGGVVDGIAYADLGSNWTSSAYTGGNGEYHRTYTWTAGASGADNATTTFTYGNANSQSTTIRLVADSDAPTGGALTYAGGYIKKGDSQSINLGLTRAEDLISGIDETTWQVWRYVGTLANDVCTFEAAPTQIAPATTYSNGQLISLVANDNLTTGRCYKYQLRVSDKVGNQAIFEPGETQVIKVDTTAPSCGSAWSPAQDDVTWKNPAETQAFTLYAQSTEHANGYSDAHSGIEASSVTCVAAAVNGATCRAVLTDRAGNTRSCTSPANRVDTGDGNASCQIDLITTGDSHAILINRQTIYYNPANGAGSFSLTAKNETQTVSGIASVSFPALADTTAEVVTPSSDTQDEFVKTYAWSGSTTSQLYNQPVTILYNNQSNMTCQVNAIADSSAPVGPDLGYQTQTLNRTGEANISLGLNKSAVTDSGVGISTWAIQVNEGTLTGDNCSFAADYTTLVTLNHDDVDEGNLSVDMTLANNKCYRFRVLVTDKLQNQATLTSSNVIKVDSTKPSVAIANVSQPNGIYYNGTDTIYHARIMESTDVIITADASVNGSTIAGVDFQNLTGDEAITDTTAPYTRTYTLPAGSTASYAERLITARTNDESQASVAFNLTYDGAGPAGAAFTTCPSGSNGYTTANSFALKATFGDDVLSGLNAGLSYIEGEMVPFEDGSCHYTGNYTRVGDYAQTDYSVVGATDGCYRYRVVSIDNVGNVSHSDVCEVKVDLADPVCGSWNPEEVTVWNTNPIGQYFTLSGSTDTASGISVAGGSCTTGANTGDTCSVTISDNAGRTKVCTSPVNKVDATQPELQCKLPADVANDYWYSTTVEQVPTLYFNGNDYASGTWRLYTELIEPPSGVVKPVRFPAIADGWTGTNYSEADGAYAQSYSWTTDGATGNTHAAVDITYGNGLTNQCIVSVVADNEAPTDARIHLGTIYLGVSSSKTVDLHLDRGEDLGSGIDETSWQVWKNVGQEVHNVCTNYAANYTLVDADELQVTKNANDEVTAIKVDLSRDEDYASGTCYHFEVSVKDKVGNQEFYASNGEVRVDLDKPVCGTTWDPNPAPWKGEAIGQTFELLDSTDLHSGMSASYYACTTEASASATCDVTIYDSAGNSETCTSPANRIDLANPVATCEIVPTSGTYYLSSEVHNLFYYNPSVSGGSFTVNTWTDEVPTSGVSHASFPALAGSAASESSESATIHGKLGFSKDYSWNTTTTRSVSDEIVSITYGNHNSNTCEVSVIADSDAPTGTAPKYLDTYLAILGDREVSLGVAMSDYQDEGSGIASLVVQRQEATLSDDTCVGWSAAWTDDHVLSYSNTDTNIIKVTDNFEDDKCYHYRVVATDRLGNSAAFSTDQVFKVDSTKPETTIVDACAGADFCYFNQANTVYYGQLGEDKNLVVTAKGNDNESSVHKLSFEALGRGSYVDYNVANNANQNHTYALAAGTNSNYLKMIIRSTNGASKTSDALLDIIYEGQGPSNVHFTSCANAHNGYEAADTFTIAGSYGQDTLSGVDTTKSYIERAVVALDHGVCDTESANWNQVGDYGATTYQEENATSQCYLYRLVSVNRLGNTTRSDVCQVKVDQDLPVCGSWNPSEVNPWNLSGGQTFILSGSTDGTSGIDVAGGSCTTGDQTGDTCTVTISDKAGRTHECVSPINRVDGDSPELTCSIEEGDNDDYQYATTVSGLPTLYFNNGTDESENPYTGSFKLGVSLTEPNSHIVTKTFPELGEGWTTRVDGLVSQNGFYTQDYDWAQGAATNNRAAVKFTYGNGASGQCVVAVVADTTAPAGGGLNYPETYVGAHTSQEIDLGLVRPTDSGAGIDESSWQVYRRTGILNAGVCSEFGEYEHVSAHLAYTGERVTGISASGTVENGYCYQYQLRVSDNVGNQTIIDAANVVKVDTQAPVCGHDWQPAWVSWKNAATAQTFILSGSTDDLSGIGAESFSCEAAGYNGATCYATIYDKAGNTATCQSPTNNIDTSSPEVTCQLIGSTGTVYEPDDTTLYFNPNSGAGQVTLHVTADSEPTSGIAKVSFPAMVDNAALESSNSATGNPRVYNRDYTWTSNTTGAWANQNVTMTFGNANNKTCQVSVFADAQAPAAPATLSYKAQVTNQTGSRSLGLGLNKSDIADSGSGVKDVTIQRRTAAWTLTGETYTCGNFGEYETIEAHEIVDFTGEEIVANDSFTTGLCYQYQVIITDQVGNAQTVAANGDIIIDSEAPAVEISSITSSSSHFYYNGVDTAYYGAMNNDSVIVTALATGGENGPAISSVTFQDLTGTQSQTGVDGGAANTYLRTYTLTSSSQATYADRSIIASNGSRSVETDFTLVHDGTAPTGVAFATCPAGAQNANAFSIKASYGTDADSGLDLTASYVLMQQGTLSGGTCTYASDDITDSSFIKVAENGATDYAVAGAATNSCYRFVIVSADRVGNSTTSSECQIQIDLDDPVCGSWQPAEVNPWRTSGGQPFSLIGSTDAGAGLQTGETTCTTAAYTGATCNVTLTDRAGNTKVCTSPENKVDGSSPALTCTITTGTNPQYQHLSDGTLYYSSRDYTAGSGRTGSFTVTTTLSEPTSGIASKYYPAFTSGFTPAGITGSAGTYTQVYNWAADAQSTGSGTIVYTFGNGTTSSCEIKVVNDKTAPSFTLGYESKNISTYETVDLQLSAVSDNQSGVNHDTWTVQRQMGILDKQSGTCDYTGSNYADTDFTYAAGVLTATSSMVDGRCYRYRASVADYVGNVSLVASTADIKADFEKPECGTWEPAEPVAWKNASIAQVFVLTGSNGGVSGMERDSYSCQAPATNGATCSVTIRNNVGVETECTSPANRIDVSAPELTVTPALDGWQDTRQDIVVTASDLLSGLSRISYAWDNNTLGSDCIGGNTIVSGSNLGSTIMEGGHTLYVCAVDAVGNVSSFTDIYQFASRPDYVDIVDNVEGYDIAWNIRSLPTNDSVVVEGVIPAMPIDKDYHLTLAIKDTDIEVSTDVSTTAGQAKSFSFIIPVSAFNPTYSKYSFAGPHTLTVTDLESGLTAVMDYNITFYFPIANTLHRANTGAYMYASDPRVNPL